jgi:hypothetical protein
MLAMLRALGVQVAGEDSYEAMRAHAAEAYPFEAVGVLLKDKSYVRLQNVAQDPTQQWEMKPEDVRRYDGDILAIHHSHPFKQQDVSPREGPLRDGPTEPDMQACVDMNCSGAVTVVLDGYAQDCLFWGDDIPIQPLWRRPFVHGVYDCYSTIRDTYRLGKDELAKRFRDSQGEDGLTDWPFDSIPLPDQPRTYGWWDQEGAKSLYLDNFKRAGFSEVDRESVQVGDVILAQIGARCPINHAALWLGFGQIGHHLRGQLSRREAMGNWSSFGLRFLRHKGSLP